MLLCQFSDICLFGAKMCWAIRLVTLCTVVRSEQFSKSSRKTASFEGQKVFIDNYRCAWMLLCLLTFKYFSEHTGRLNIGECHSDFPHVAGHILSREKIMR